MYRLLQWYSRSQQALTLIVIIYVNRKLPCSNLSGTASQGLPIEECEEFISGVKVNTGHVWSDTITEYADTRHYCPCIV